MLRILYICSMFFPLLFVAQEKNKKAGSDRLEIVGKWNSYSSKDTAKTEVVEFKPDGSFVSYNANGVPQHSTAKYVFYKDELSVAVTEGKDHITLKFRVRKESYGLYLTLISMSQKFSEDLKWVKLLPWKPK